jgi:hypothetical protein
VTCLLLAGLVPVAAPSPAAVPGAGRPRALPELLDDAVETGELDRATADLHLARAFAGGTRYREVPSRFQSTVPWHGTMPLFHLKQRLARMPEGATRSKIAETIALAATTTCGDSSGTLPSEASTTHFYIEYGSIGGGLTLAAYQSALEQSWTTQITTYGWAAPPVKVPAPPGNRYPVRIDSLGLGLYGYVTTGGTYAGRVGNNPNTSWNDIDADASCMVLNNDYTGFPGAPLQALQATAAHEFNHAIQFGMGVQWGANVPDDSFFEGIATWMEDQVFDGANDNWNYLWPVFSDSMGDYDGSSYEFWILMRGLTERFGTDTPGGGEQVMQDFWENASKGIGQGDEPGRRVPPAVHRHRLHAYLRRRLRGAVLFRGGRWFHRSCRAAPDDRVHRIGGRKLLQQPGGRLLRPLDHPPRRKRLQGNAEQHLRRGSTQSFGGVRQRHGSDGLRFPGGSGGRSIDHADRLRRQRMRSPAGGHHEPAAVCG